MSLVYRADCYISTPNYGGHLFLFLKLSSLIAFLPPPKPYSLCTKDDYIPISHGNIHDRKITTMGPLQKASEVSTAKAHGPDPGKIASKKRSHEFAPRKRRTFQQVLPRSFVADSPIFQTVQEPVGISWDGHSSAAHARRTNVEGFIGLQELHIRACISDSDTFKSKFDDICLYGVSATQEARLWRLETERLATAVGSSITHHPFTSTIAEDPDDASLETLSRVASEVIRNITVCEFDNKLALFERNHELFDKAELSISREAILASRESKVDGGTTKTTIDFSRLRVLEEKRRKFYCALVDYVTVVAARCVSPVAGNDWWYRFRILSLARLAAKLKFLSIDSEGFASQSIDNERNVVQNSMGIDHGAIASQKFSASSWALEILLSIFSGLKCEKRPGAWRNYFKMGIIVYESGWKDEPIILDQDQLGEISGRCVRLATWGIRAAFETLAQISDIVERHAANDATRYSSWAQASIMFEYQDSSLGLSNGNSTSPCKGGLETLADIVAFMVPLLFMQPKRLPQLNRPPSIVTEPSYHPGDFRGSFGTETALPAFAELAVGVSDARTLASFEILRQGLAKKVDTGSQRWLSSIEPLTVQPTKWTTKEIQSASGQSWAIEERSIVVKRRLYVVMTMIACGILVVGGVLAGLLVGERIPGVDPFNIATFAWLLAAFITVMAKSLSVREWPWRDFLHGQVPCRSVSELQTVTGIGEQDILRYLLANDAYTILTTRGPYNLFHTRRSDDGSSIDVKMELRTLITSGIVVFRVATHMGPALVCLDLRRGVEGRTSIRHVDGPREGERLLGCFDFPEAIDGELDVQLQTLSKPMTWTRILGVYDNLDKKFR